MGTNDILRLIRHTYQPYILVWLNAILPQKTVWRALFLKQDLFRLAQQYRGEKTIINGMKETESSYFVECENGAKYEFRKKDLGVITLAVGNAISIIKHPGYPSIVSGLDLCGHRVFHKSREEVSDEWREGVMQSMVKTLPLAAQHLLKMYEKFIPEFNCYRLMEIAALKLGTELNERVKADMLIDNFVKLPRQFQVMVLPSLENHLLPGVPMEKVVLVAKACAVDERKKIDCSDLSQLRDSAVMHLHNSTAERYGEFCQPRSKYISRYLKAAAQ